jgi:prevent-host-death family protein
LNAPAAIVFKNSTSPWSSYHGHILQVRSLPDRKVIHALATVCYRFTMKLRTITQRELRNDSAAVLREVEAGRTIVVTRNGTPVGELRPVNRRRFVPRAAIAEASGNAARIDAEQFRADLDAVVDPRPHD